MLLCAQRTGIRLARLSSHERIPVVYVSKPLRNCDREEGTYDDGFDMGRGIAMLLPHEHNCCRQVALLSFTQHPIIHSSQLQWQKCLCAHRRPTGRILSLRIGSLSRPRLALGL